LSKNGTERAKQRTSISGSWAEPQRMVSTGSPRKPGGTPKAASPTAEMAASKANDGTEQQSQKGRSRA